VTVLESEPDPGLRTAAVLALGRAGDTDAAVKILADVAKNDASSKVRHAAVQVLGGIQTDAARKALLDILKDRSAETKGDRE
jgi:HEAT repeat protein